MKISVFGAGYVGLVTAVGFAEIGNTVTCMDFDVAKIDKLREGKAAFYEPGLEELLARNVDSNRILFTSSQKEAVTSGDILFIAAGTPPQSDGSADLSAIFDIASAIGQFSEETKVIVTKSTVPVGTFKRVRDIIQAELDRRGEAIAFRVVSNPEFLKEGTAVDDFMKPDRIVVGADDPAAFEVMRELYAPFQRRESIIIEMDIASAELTKYSANAFLAARISLMNEISRIAERVGADIEQIRHGVGSDPRIGHSFLYAGCGYGGSCFQKDVNALIHTAESLGLNPQLLKSVDAVNESQKNSLFEKIHSHFNGHLADKTFAVWGLSFKPDTDDMRCAPSIPLITALHRSGAKIHAYDPVAIPTATDIFSDLEKVYFHESKYSALRGADALILVTEWKEFRAPDFEEISRALNQAIVFDGRNQWDPIKLLTMGFQYFSIGRPLRATPQTKGTATNLFDLEYDSRFLET
ncbi:UDP-glucose/GDP-mannose dehydrogenase family protein [bacterium]|nr:MAG: UDP-glucose/GDP-mannose dehydrogenase family protein [bacterium]